MTGRHPTNRDQGRLPVSWRGLNPAICFLFLAGFLYSTGPASAQELTVDPFALPDYLLETGQYETCAVEYLRQGFAYPSLRARSVERAALCLQMAGDQNGALRLISHLVKEEGTGALEGMAAFRLCMGHLMQSQGRSMGDCDQAVSTFTKPEDLPNNPDVARTRYVTVMADLLVHIPGDPETVAPWTTAPDPVLQSWALEDRVFAARGRDLPRRRPWLAGMLSAVVPGLGRVYVGRWKDAIFSFTFVVSPAAVSAYTFSKRGSDSVFAWSLAAVSAGMYAGNVYGSLVGARVFNADQQEALRREMLSSYRRRLDP